MKNLYPIPLTRQEKTRRMLRQVLAAVVLFAALSIFLLSGAAAWLVQMAAGQPGAPGALPADVVEQLIIQGVGWTFSQAGDEERALQICQFGTPTYCSLAQKRLLVRYPGVTWSNLVVVGRVDSGVFAGAAEETWEVQLTLGGQYQPDFNDGFWSNAEKQVWADTFQVSWIPFLPEDVYTAYLWLQQQPDGAWRFSHILTGQESLPYVINSIPDIQATLAAAARTPTPQP